MALYIHFVTRIKRKGGIPMKKFTKVIAVAAAMTMLFSTVVMAATSPSTATVAVSDSISTANLAPTTVVTAYVAGVESTTPGVTVAPVNAATVNYSTLAAKLLVGPTAVVLKSVTLNGTVNNASLTVPGLANGQKVTVLAYDLATGTWKKISCKVKNGQVSFKAGGSSIFSIVTDVVAP